MLKIVGPIALAIITITASRDEATNGLQRRLLGDDDKHKPNLDIWNGDYSKDNKNKNDKDDKGYDYNDYNNKDKDDDKLKVKKNDNDGHYDNDNNGKYIDDNHRYSQYKPYYHDNDKDNDRNKGWNADYYASNYRQNKWNNDYDSDKYYDKRDDNKKGGWNNNDNHYEPNNVYYGANHGGYSNNWNNYHHGYEYDNNKQKYNNDYRPYRSSSSNQYYTRSTGWDNNYNPKPMAMYVSEAIVILNVGDGSGVDGFIKFEDIDHGKKTKITAKITGLKPGKHGWHVHQFGDIFTDGCASAGPHYNPLTVNHGSPDDDKYKRHIGDLGNIYADKDGVAYIDEYDEIIKLNGPNSIIGRGFVIHSDEDDLGKGGNDESLQTGNAGDRIACGVIGIKKED